MKHTIKLGSKRFQSGVGAWLQQQLQKNAYTVDWSINTQTIHVIMAYLPT